MAITKKNKLILLGVGSVALILIAVALATRSGDDDEGFIQNKTAVTNVPDAEDTPMDESKSEAYRKALSNSSVEDYWNDLDENGEDDLYADPRGKGAAKEPQELSVDDLWGGSEKETKPAEKKSEPRGSYSRVPQPGDPGYREYRMKQYEEDMAALMAMDGYEEQKAEPTAAEEPKPAESVLPESKIRKSTAMSTLDGFSDGSDDGFSSLDSEDEMMDTDNVLPFECTFVRDEKLYDGSRVSVRLLSDMVVDGTLVPKNTFLMATCKITDRLELTFPSLERGGRIYALGYEAYDSDGVKGIYCPDIGETIRRNVRRRGTSLLGSILGNRAGSLAGDVAAVAGGIVQTGVSVAQSKNGEITVTVPSGYKFYILKVEK